MPDYLGEGSDKLVTEGYETTYDDPENYTETEFETDGDSKSPSGRSFDPVANNSTSLTLDQFNQIVFGDDNRVFGMPFKYSPLADPLMRTYESTFEDDNNIIFINFGTTKINRFLYGKLSAGSGLEEIAGEVATSITTMSSGTDPRFISFKPNFKEFYKYVSTAANYLWAMMDLPGGFDWDANFQSVFGKSGVAFYVTKNTSVSEGLSNEYGEASVVSQANNNAVENRQNYMFQGQFQGITDGPSFGETIATKLTESVEEMLGNMPIIGSIASVFFQTNKGSMQSYGKIWGNSTVNNSYSINFKFVSPYGNKVDVFRNIYFPFLLLYTAAQARQDGKYAYREPFLVKVQYPGWFIIDCGAIVSLTWIKGGDNQLYSSEGLPLEMNVTMEVEDLYPTSMSSKIMTYVKYNRNLLCFLENMAGVSVTQLSLKSFKAKIKASFTGYGQKARDFITLRSLRNSATDMYTSIAGKIMT